MYTKNAIYLIENVLIPLQEKIKKNDLVAGTAEIINANLVFDATDTKLHLGESRKAQHKYIENEHKWYMSQDRCIKGHKGIEDNKIWSRICTDDGRVNSNYGWCVFSPENGRIYYDGLTDNKRHIYIPRNKVEKSQYKYALEQLIEKPDGRQSIIYYGRPQMQWEWNDGINAKSDFTCTITTQHFIRKNRFDYIVTMRSNDVIRGLHCGDLPWHGFVYEYFLKDIRMFSSMDPERGNIYWNAGSLHIYERDFELLDKIIKEYFEYLHNQPEVKKMYENPNSGFIQ